MSILFQLYQQKGHPLSGSCPYKATTCTAQIDVFRWIAHRDGCTRISFTSTFIAHHFLQLFLTSYISGSHSNELSPSRDLSRILISHILIVYSHFDSHLTFSLKFSHRILVSYSHIMIILISYCHLTIILILYSHLIVDLIL